MSSFSIPLTGLEASSKALNTIANNLSNMNTTAFKSQSVTFSDLFFEASSKAITTFDSISQETINMIH
jgi:flagellar hook protein FlgE